MRGSSAAKARSERNTPITTKRPLYLDNDTLDELTRLSEREDFFEELVNNFLSDVYACSERMEVAMNLLDIEQFTDEAHAIKGAAGNIGATILFNKSAQLNRASSEEIRRNGRRYLEELEEVIDATKSALERYIQEHDIDIKLKSR